VVRKKAACFSLEEKMSNRLRQYALLHNCSMSDAVGRLIGNIDFNLEKQLSSLKRQANDVVTLADEIIQKS